MKRRIPRYVLDAEVKSERAGKARMKAAQAYRDKGGDDAYREMKRADVRAVEASERKRRAWARFNKVRFPLPSERVRRSRRSKR